MTSESLERRNITERAALVRSIVTSVVDNPSVTLTVETLHTWLDVPMEAAQRILGKLAASGLVRELDNGVWVRASVR